MCITRFIISFILSVGCFTAQAGSFSFPDNLVEININGNRLNFIWRSG
jgi:hypothetical protein